MTAKLLLQLPKTELQKITEALRERMKQPRVTQAKEGLIDKKPSEGDGEVEVVGNLPADAKKQAKLVGNLPASKSKKENGQAP
jgi:hypothetical protein